MTVDILKFSKHTNNFVSIFCKHRNNVKTKSDNKRIFISKGQHDLMTVHWTSFITVRGGGSYCLEYEIKDVLVYLAKKKCISPCLFLQVSWGTILSLCLWLVPLTKQGIYNNLQIGTWEVSKSLLQSEKRKELLFCSLDSLDCIQLVSEKQGLCPL